MRNLVGGFRTRKAKREDAKACKSPKGEEVGDVKSRKNDRAEKRAKGEPGS